MIGSGENGNSGIYIGDEFRTGYSGINETYDNPVLGKERHFLIDRFEVWGFDHI